MEQQLKFIREVAGPMGYIWISSVASPLWSMEVEYCVDNDKLKFSVRDKDTLTEAVEEMYDKIVRISSRLPEYDKRKQIEHYEAPDLPKPAFDDEIPF